MAHHIFGIRLSIVALEFRELSLQISDFVLEVYDVVSGDFDPFGRVKVLAVGVCSFARAATRKSWIATSLPLCRYEFDCS
jgi:hypothetical protein